MCEACRAGGLSQVWIGGGWDGTYLEDGLVDAVRVHARRGRDDQGACGSNRVSSHDGQMVVFDNDSLFRRIKSMAVI